MQWFRACRPHFFVFCVGLLILSCSVLAKDNHSRPNIIVIVCDDMGFSDLGCYGGEIETPNLDALAAGGLRFTDFHNNAKCSETRASLLTGLWHQQSKNLSKNNYVTLAEVLQTAGYSTLMSGKWHVAHSPNKRGFEQYFGFLNGCINFFTGESWEATEKWGTGETEMQLNGVPFKAPKDFYSTDAFTDYAIEFLDRARSKQQPYFLYLAHNAPHFPLHALPEDIAKYRGKYSQGWDVIRQKRMQNLLSLGIADDNWRLSLRDPKVEPWDELAANQKSFLEPMMEVYAAMVDRLDQNIGRLVANLKANQELDNTLIIFFSDNGACPYQRLRNGVTVPGPANSAIAYDARWANMCNTPLRLYKQYAHQGGTLTPMIAHWPAVINTPGGLSGFTGHIVDLMPTVVEISGASYPRQFEGRQVLPMEGESLLAALRGNVSNRSKPIFWEFSNNHAIRDGDWKLVAERSKDWELYHLSKDRTETTNLAKLHPDTVADLAAKYDTWAARTGARLHAKAIKSKPSSQSQLFKLDQQINSSPK